MTDSIAMSGVELVMTTSATGAHPSTSDVRIALSQSGISDAYAKPIQAVTAFRRAAESLKAKDRLVRVYASKLTGRLNCQVDSLEQSDGSLVNHMVTSFELVEDEPAIILTNYSTSDSYRLLDDSFRDALTHYTWADVSKLIRDILIKDGLGVYSPRKNGGIYFVPTTDNDGVSSSLLDKLSTFAGLIGIRLLRYTVPNDSAQKAEVSEAICAGLNEEVSIHEDAIAAYSDNPRSDAIKQRIEAIIVTTQLISRISHLIEDGGELVIQRLAATSNRLTDILNAKASIQPRGRRISV